MASVGRTPRKNSSVRMIVQNSVESSPPPIVRVTIPKVPLTKKSKHKEPLALIRRKMLAKNQEIQEIKILGYGEDMLHAQESPSLIHSPVHQEDLLDDELCTRFNDNEVATQTAPVYCFNTMDEIVEFLNSCNKHEDTSPQAMSFSEEPPDEPGGEEDTYSSDDHMRTLKMEIEEDDDQPIVSRLYPNPPCFPVVKRRRKQRFHCDWQGPATIISSPNIPAHAAELRVDEELAMSIRRQVDVNNPGPFGWQLAKLLFTEDELYGHNFNGTDQKLPLSPRRIHAIQHAFHDYFPKDIADEALAKGRTAINQGIRNMFYIRNRRDGEYT
ncbi:uncharacterized protein LOC128659180 [Bombina bombina]|uniref:uncharacterized protein LOC128659180 n=1 Tax=Bombina bombina TaxID=8345 RepID=UPI00235AB9E9|nr:uncharacterized protein LOC128659180 [Bombina bombina]